MLYFPEKSRTSVCLTFLPGLVFVGWDLMLVDPSWVSIVPVKCLWGDMKPSFV
jgi:hypothetical protein